jgi:plasmid stabilization system protein ParE
VSLTLVLRPAAQAEFDEAAAWYEAKKAGLGSDFVDEVQHILDTIVGQPDRYPIADGDVREALLSKFPYCIYYRVKPDRLVVLAVFHTARDPAVWQSRS